MLPGSNRGHGEDTAVCLWVSVRYRGSPVMFFFLSYVLVSTLKHMAKINDEHDE